MSGYRSSNLLHFFKRWDSPSSSSKPLPLHVAAVFCHSEMFRLKSSKIQVHVFEMTSASSPRNTIASVKEDKSR
jgi:hypothetical protein